MLATRAALVLQTPHDAVIPTTLLEIEDQILTYNTLPSVGSKTWSYDHEVPDKMLRIAVHGDDNITGYSGPTSMFNPQYLALFMKYLGYTITAADKSIPGKEWKTLSQCTFLKRTFELHPMTGKIEGPLLIDTIAESPQWTTDRIDSEQIAKSCFDDMMIELAFHHPKVWGDWAPKLTGAYSVAYGETYPWSQAQNLCRARSLSFMLQ
jgi:hypothetical protein